MKDLQLQHTGHSTAAGGGGCRPRSTTEYFGIKVQKHTAFRIRLEKRKLLTGELEKSDFSSEVFPRFARCRGAVAAIPALWVFISTGLHLHPRSTSGEREQFLFSSFNPSTQTETSRMQGPSL